MVGVGRAWPGGSVQSEVVEKEAREKAAEEGEEEDGSR